MPLPRIAIVGRPNVGKSSLFNWLAGRRIAIVEPTAGVTRDRLTAPLILGSRTVEIVDTGGMGIQDHDNLTQDVEHQIALALREAEIVLFVVDARTGAVPLDEMVAARLRRFTKPIILVVNKCDHDGLDAQASDFYRLGYGQPLCVSAQQNRGKYSLYKKIMPLLPDDSAAIPSDTAEVALKVAIVGRRNTGKSTFINCLAQEERTIVSEVPGTTRDSIDVRFERDGKVFLAIDTAGVRRKQSLANSIEFYSMTRAERSIRRADVVLHFHDPRVNISKVDKKLADYILEEYRPAIFVVNKWDLAKDTIATGDFAAYLQRTFRSLDFVPFAFITAKEGKNVYAVLNLAQSLHKQASARVSTGDLNRVLRAAIERNPPPLRHNRQGKLYYATQVAANPPTLVLFTNGPELFDETYQRYLLRAIRDNLPYREVPIKMYLRERSRTERDASAPRDDEQTVKVKPIGRKRPTKTAKKPELWNDA